MSDRIDRTERLLNLVIALMATSIPVARVQIRQQIPGYSSSASDAAFERMFERDKDELRSMGIPIETVTDSGGEVLGYRIPQDRYALADLDLTLEERAAIAVAAQVWGQAAAAPLAGAAMRKLQSHPTDADAWDPAGLSGSIQLTTSDAALLPLMSAIRQDREVSFGYRAPADDAPRVRTVSPWVLRSVSGRWVLVGHDRDRDAVRTFRLSRITDAVTVLARQRHAPPPEGFDATTSADGAEERPIRATVEVAPQRAASVRRAAVPETEDPWTARQLDIEGPTLDALAALICGAGADVRVLGPAEVVDAVRAGLAAVLAAHGEPA